MINRTVSRIVLAIMGTLALVSGLSLFGPTSSDVAGAPPVVQSVVAVTAPEPASAAPYNYAKIKNSTGSTSAQRLLVCKDWGNTSCASSSVRKSLSRGETSPWSDADGYYIPSGYYVRFQTGSTNSKAGWHKISGCFGCTHVLKLLRK